MKKVAYIYNQAITNYHFSKQHPMKTKRIKMTHSLIQNYNLNDYLCLYESKLATRQQLLSFHNPDYIEYLQNWVIGPKQDHNYSKKNQKKKLRQDNQLKSKFKINQSFDCPGFQGLYNYCQLTVGGSLDAADIITVGLSNIVINWSGGYHHAKKSQASGFCYINDIVICILELLRTYPRVIYIDIDVHHGDGVQEAFYTTNRVMTVSFHEYDQDFFPGTGSLSSVGQGIGKYYAVNIPLKRGIDDITYCQIFRKVMKQLMNSYRPDVCVMQCGADSLSRDRLGHLNLSINGHGQCIKHILTYNIPIIFLGGGGYTIENVSRCWAYQTANIIGIEIANQIPIKDNYYHLYQSDQYKIHFPINKRYNQNSQQYLNKIYQTIIENIRQSEIRPSIAFHNAPKRFLTEENINWEIISENQNSLQDQSLNRIFQYQKY